jgi:hypothetical protein
MRVPVLLLLLPLLAGCTDADWDNLISFGGHDAATQVATAAPAVATPPAPPASNAFCMDVARKDATTNDFDEATQQRVAVRSYQQCVAIFGN